MSSRTFALPGVGLLAAALLIATFTGPAQAAGWESIDRSELINRSRYIGIGRIAIRGRAVDGFRPARITFSQQIYSGIGDVSTYEVQVAIKDEPGKMQRWRDGEEGVWFILKSGDKYEAINHPACKEDKDEAEEIANEVNGEAEQEYAQAQEDAEAASEAAEDGDEDAEADEAEAYERMAEAAYTAANTPYQNSAQQTQQSWDRMNQMLEMAGVQSPFPKDVTSAAGQNKLFDQAKQMMGPLGDKLGSLPGAGAERTQMIQMLQRNVSNIVTQVIGATMGAMDPAKGLANMKPVGLQMPGGKGPGGGGPPIGPGSSGGPKPQFKMPDSVLKSIPSGGGRKGALNSALGGLTKGGPGSGGPKPPNIGGPPKPGGGGPPRPGGGGPGRGPGGPPRGPGGP